MRKVQLAVVTMVLGAGTVVFAQESEFQNKMQEDLDFYKPQFVSKCHTSDAITFKFAGKLGANPRETRVSISCTQAVEAALYSCDTNATVAGYGFEPSAGRDIRIATGPCVTTANRSRRWPRWSRPSRPARSRARRLASA